MVSHDSVHWNAEIGVANCPKVAGSNMVAEFRGFTLNLNPQTSPGPCNRLMNGRRFGRCGPKDIDEQAHEVQGGPAHMSRKSRAVHVLSKPFSPKVENR